jgi:hypothetical protein
MRTLISTCLLLCATLAQAAADPIVACRTDYADDPAAHIACLENALRANGNAAARTEPIGAYAGPATSTTTSLAAPATATMTATASTTTTSSGAAASASPTSGTFTATAIPATPTGLGAEQAKAQQRGPSGEPASVPVHIVGVRYDAEGVGYFTLADGQVWTETVRSPERVHLDPDQEYDARIEVSKIGGYRLYVDGVRWMHKVKRLK